jgi:uncharacterized coiled-coil DUF342 family protein
MLKTNILQSGIESDSIDQLQNKLKRYATEIESLRGRGIGKKINRIIYFPLFRSKIFFSKIGTDKLKEELHEAIYTSRYLPIEDRKNKPFYELLLRLYGSNQVIELATICTKDVLQTKQERDHANEIKWRDEKIDELTRFNQELNREIERLKAALNELSSKSNKPLWRPVPASNTIIPRETNNNKSRQTLKPNNVQFGTKPGAS